MTMYLIDSLHSGGIITNYHCNSTCKHCVYKSSPQRQADFITPEVIKSILVRTGQMGCRSYHIGGGEPFLGGDNLERAVAVMQDTGAPLEYIETNAIWCKNMQQAEKRLRRLRQRGVACLLISISPYHNEFIPLQRVDQLIDLCAKLKVAVFLYQRQFHRELSQLDGETTHSLTRQSEVLYEEGGDSRSKGYALDVARRFSLSLRGRALEYYAPLLPERQPAAEIVAQCDDGCVELRESHHFHVDLYGYYIPQSCVGLGIPLIELDKQLDGSRYPILTLLAVEGLGALYRYAIKKYNFQPDQQGYIYRCHLCQQIREFIVLGGHYPHHDLYPREFYTKA